MLILENPGLKGQTAITHSLFAGLQLILPGEVAPAHRHTQSALRFIIEGHGAYTAVDGERTTMRPGDFVITPSWTWHDHGNDTEEPMVWLDGLDIPIVRLLDASFAEPGETEAQTVTRPEGDSAARYANNLLPVDWQPAVKTSPVFNYPYLRSRESLDDVEPQRGPRSLPRPQIALCEPGERRLRDADDRRLYSIIAQRFCLPALPLDRRHGLCRRGGRRRKPRRRPGLPLAAARRLCRSELAAGQVIRPTRRPCCSASPIVRCSRNWDCGARSAATPERAPSTTLGIDVRRLAMMRLLSALAAVLAAAAQVGPANALEARHGMVVTAHRLASEIGAGILAQGGNAIDAAVAVGYALAVVDPCCGNIGGGGFMTIRLADGRRTFLDFRETAPAAANAGMFLGADGEPSDGASRYGYLAVAVPGTVKGLERAAQEYGRLTRRALLGPAIALARDGFVLTRADTDIIDARADRIAKDPAAASVFLRPDGSRLAPGDRLVQHDLAATLERIAQDGADAFYRGAIPQAVETASRNGGGVITAQDFARYAIVEKPPLSCSYRGYVLYSAPPPSSGGVTICEILNIIKGRDVEALGFRSVRSVAFLVEAMRQAYHDRNAFLGDPAFVENPLDRLLSKGYAAGVRAAIEAREGGPTAAPAEHPREQPQTTHYSIVDGEGNAVAVTYTINGFFGAAVMAPGTGFFLNNEMDDFATKPGRPNLYGLVQGASNAVMPGKRPLSSMAPTIVEKNGKTVLVLGSPGGSRIITTVLEALINIVDYGMSPQAAVDAPRLHHQERPEAVYYERRGLSPEVAAGLKELGYKLVEQRPWGAVELIAIEDGRLTGASDPRRPAGAAIGY